MTDKWQEGYDAFHSGKGLGAANPYGFRNGRNEWNAGWMYAREEAYIGWKLGQSLKAAGLTG